MADGCPVLLVEVEGVHVPARRLRELDPSWAAALAIDIGARGLLQPILVRPRPRGGWWLVAGLARLDAVRRLGWAAIEARPIRDAGEAAVLEAEAAENLVRAEPVALDLCRTLHVLKAVHEAAHPEARHGGDRRSAAARARRAEAGSSRQVGDLIGADEEASAFAERWAVRIGLSSRAILRCVQIWDGLSPASRRRLVGTVLAANQSELQLLSEQGHERQARILDLMLDPAHPVDCVRAAIEHLEGAAAESAMARRFRLWSEGFARLSVDQVDHFTQVHRDALVASLRRQGAV